MSRTTCHVTQSVDAFSFLFAIVREGDNLGYPCLEAWLILKWIFRKWNGVKYWIEIVQCRSRQRNILNAVMNRKCCIMWGLFLDKLRNV